LTFEQLNVICLSTVCLIVNPYIHSPIIHNMVYLISRSILVASYLYRISYFDHTIARPVDNSIRLSCYPKAGRHLKKLEYIFVLV